MKHLYFFLLLFIMISIGEQGIMYELEWINNELKVGDGEYIGIFDYITLYWTLSRKKPGRWKPFRYSVLLLRKIRTGKRKQVVDQLVKFLELWRRPQSYSATLHTQTSIVRITYEMDHREDQTFSNWRLFKFVENEGDLFFLQVPLNSLNSVHIADVFILVNNEYLYTLTTSKHLKTKNIPTKKLKMATFLSNSFKTIHTVKNKKIIKDIKSWPMIDSNISPTIRPENDNFADEVKMLNTKIELIWYSNKERTFHKENIRILKLNIEILLKKECVIIHNKKYKEAFIYIKNQANIETIRNILKKGEELATNEIKVLPISRISAYPPFFGLFKELVKIINETSYEETYDKLFSTLDTSYFI